MELSLSIVFVLIPNLIRKVRQPSAQVHLTVPIATRCEFTLLETGHFEIERASSPSIRFRRQPRPQCRVDGRYSEHFFSCMH